MLNKTIIIKVGAWPFTRFTGSGNGQPERSDLAEKRQLHGHLLRNIQGFRHLDLEQHGSCGLSDGSTTGQWRLTNINELESLVDVFTSSPALPIGHRLPMSSPLTIGHSAATQTIPVTLGSSACTTAMWSAALRPETKKGSGVFDCF